MVEEISVILTANSEFRISNSYPRLGFETYRENSDGATGTRERTEAVYVALIQLVDRRPQKSGQPAKLVTFSMALRPKVLRHKG